MFFEISIGRNGEVIMLKRNRCEWRVFVLVALLLSLLAACKPADEVRAPNETLLLRVAVIGDCPDCEKAAYSPNGGFVVSLKLKGVIAKASDIESITKSVDGDKVQVALSFKEGSRPDIRDASMGASGQMCAWVVDGKVVKTAAISSPFSDELVVSGMTSGEADRLFDAVSQHK
jgi:preprotein translocase subunit SecD